MAVFSPRRRASPQLAGLAAGLLHLQGKRLRAAYSLQTHFEGIVRAHNEYETRLTHTLHELRAHRFGQSASAHCIVRTVFETSGSKRGSMCEPHPEQSMQGTTVIPEPVSKMTVNFWGGVPTLK